MKDRPHSPRKNDSSGWRRVYDQLGGRHPHWFKDVAQMFAEEKLGAPPREAMCAARP